MIKISIGYGIQFQVAISKMKKIIVTRIGYENKFKLFRLDIEIRFMKDWPLKIAIIRIRSRSSNNMLIACCYRDAVRITK